MSRFLVRAGIAVAQLTALHIKKLNVSHNNIDNHSNVVEQLLQISDLVQIDLSRNNILESDLTRIAEITTVDMICSRLLKNELDIDEQVFSAIGINA